MSSLEQQQQQQQQRRPTLQLAADAEDAVEFTVVSSPVGGVGGDTAGFLPEMPQWKKDLIQRRKTNVSRTIGASSPNSALPAVFALKSKASPSASVSSDDHLTAFNETADSSVTDAAATTKVLTTITSQEQQQQKHVKRNVNQTTFKTSPTEEKSEKCYIGGHHTLPAAASTMLQCSSSSSLEGKDSATTATTKATAAGNAPIPKQRSSLFNTPAAARSQPTSNEPENLNMDVREQRERERSTSKQQQMFKAAVTTREHDFDVDVAVSVNAGGMAMVTNNGRGEVETSSAAAAASSLITTTNTMVTATTTTATGALTVIGGSSSSGGGAAANVKLSAVTAATTTSSSSANQLQTKCKVGLSGADVAAISPTKFSSNSNNSKEAISTTATIISTSLPVTTIDKNCKAKISDKLQSNKFIKNQQQLELATSSSSNNNNGGSSRQTLASPTKVAVKTTMVAVQEMKKTTTQNGQHRHHHHHHHHHNHHAHHANSKSGDTTAAPTAAAGVPMPELVDTGEDLSYGPGIVSKLRCRYLSLALRESRQQQHKQGLQRSTSLNTLLDRDDDDDELNSSGEVLLVQPPSHVVTASAAQRSQAPPIGVKPAHLSGGGSGSYIKSPTAPANLMQRQLSGGTAAVQLRSNLPSTQTTEAACPLQTNGAGNRSRHFKRGNEVMKRARSVEALLCEKSPWNTVQRSSYQPPPVSAGGGMSTCVTIEDKIHNARERLHSGTDAAPPKRLTSIIDDTERPPPDLVKQTLKMFEASANRRPRAAQRNNGTGGVASKVASYKSIIKEQKQQQQPNAARPALSSPALKSPTSLSKHEFELGMAFSGASTPKQQRPLMSDCSTPVPDVIPRQVAAELAEPMIYDSPVTALGKMLAGMQLDADGDVKGQKQQQQQQIQQTESLNNLTTGGGVVVNSHRLVIDKHEGGLHEVGTAGKNNNDQQQNNEGSAVEGGGGDGNVVVVDNETNNDGGREPDVNNDSSGDACDSDNMGAAGIGLCSSSKIAVDSDKFGQAASVCETAAAITEATIAAGGGLYAVSNRLYENTTTTTAKSASSNGAASTINNRKLTQRTEHDSGSSSILSSSGAVGGGHTKQIGIIRPLFNSAGQSASSGGLPAGGGQQILTSREIEKNRINEMKKSTALAADTATPTHGAGTTITSLDTVINTKQHDGSGSSHETDAAVASPIWALRKRRQPTAGAAGAASIGNIGGGGSSSSVHNAENTSMVFNFSKSTKEVPDYIESDVVIYRRKRELPKPNEPGFVLLGDLSVETSTDSDYDDYSMCPPSPCDVEFENANIVIDGKSSIRQKPKESSFRVQFNDTLTSTFEYPSEASMTIEDQTYADPYGVSVKNHQLLMDHQQQQHHHHVTVDEIIELPTSTATHKTSSSSNILGNLPLGSAALGFYTPIKGGSPMDSLFQLGVTRYTTTTTTDSSSSDGLVACSTPTPTTNGKTMAFNGNGSIVGLGEGLIKDDAHAVDTDADDTANIDYLTPAGGVNIVYSEGTQKTDLLY